MSHVNETCLTHDRDQQLAASISLKAMRRDMSTLLSQLQSLEDAQVESEIGSSPTPLQVRRERERERER